MQKKYCSNCGTTAISTLQFCPVCGSKSFSSSPPLQYHPVSSSPNSVSNSSMLTLPSTNSDVAYVNLVYLYTIGAIVGLFFLSVIWFKTGVGLSLLDAIGTSKMAWLVVLCGFWILSLVANYFVAQQSFSIQCFGLAFYVLLESILFAPMFTIVFYQSGADTINAAIFATALIVVALTSVVLFSRSDFSILRVGLSFGIFFSLGLIILSAIAGFELGPWFSYAMVVFASACILYETHEVMSAPEKPPAPAAALRLFSSITLLLWYVLRLLGRRN